MPSPFTSGDLVPCARAETAHSSTAASAAATLPNDKRVVETHLTRRRASDTVPPSIEPPMTVDSDCWRRSREARARFETVELVYFEVNDFLEKSAKYSVA